jgi:hypothetical protein
MTNEMSFVPVIMNILRKFIFILNKTKKKKKNYSKILRDLRIIIFTA